jgi:phosphate transport system substrate-binding protein
LNVSGLTIAQLSDIYTGKVTNWNQLGGPDLKIVPYSRTFAAGGTVDFFVEYIMRYKDLTRKTKYVRTTTSAIQQVASDPGGIYYASASELIGQCGVKPLALFNSSRQLIPPYQEPLVPASACPQKRNQINRPAIKSAAYPITRRLFAVIKLNNQADERAGEAYANWLLTPQGQEAIEKAGFVRIN